MWWIYQPLRCLYVDTPILYILYTYLYIIIQHTLAPVYVGQTQIQLKLVSARVGNPECVGISELSNLLEQDTKEDWRQQKPIKKRATPNSIALFLVFKRTTNISIYVPHTLNILQFRIWTAIYSWIFLAQCYCTEWVSHIIKRKI